MPITCGKYCGTIGDGCGRKLDCRRVRRRPAMPRRHLRRPRLRAADVRRRPQRPLLRHDRRRLRRHARLRHCPNGGPAAARRHPQRLQRPDSAQDRRARRWAASTAASSATTAAARRTAARAPTAWRAGTGASAHVCPGSMATRAADLHRRHQDDDQRRRSTTPPASTRSTTSSSTSRAARCRRWPKASPATAAAPRSNAPLASALTDTQGRLHADLEPVPSTTNIPLVIQVGKWRRQITIPIADDVRRQRAHRQGPDAAAAHQSGRRHPATSP